VFCLPIHGQFKCALCHAGNGISSPGTRSATGRSFSIGIQPFYFSPTFGPGKLTVNAKLIDLGNLSLQNIGKANFNAVGGDIRGDGTFDVAGGITLNSGTDLSADGGPLHHCGL